MREGPPGRGLRVDEAHDRNRRLSPVGLRRPHRLPRFLSLTAPLYRDVGRAHASHTRISAKDRHLQCVLRNLNSKSLTC